MWWALFPLPLEARQFITRLLCWIVVVGWLLFVPLLVGFAAILRIWTLRSEPEVILANTAIAVFILTFAAVSFARFGLMFCRSCDRCHKPLFKAEKMVGLGMPHDLANLGGQLSAPDYRAKRLLGSYSNGAIWTMAKTGSVHCMWCGHEDGTKLDYVVEASSD